MAAEKFAQPAVENTQRPTRNMVVWLLGTPSRTEGSLNDPREQEEFAVRFNEKWIYVDPATAQLARVVYWHRYDFVGSAAPASDGTWRLDGEIQQRLGASDLPLPRDRRSPEELRAGQAERDGRMYYFGGKENPPVRPSNQHRPVSDFKHKADLGGYAELD